MDSVFAQTASSNASAQTSSPFGGIISFAPIILIGVMFYFLIIHPQNKERKKREELLKGIQRGDRVLTRGGIYGIVADIKDQILVLKINENSKIEVDRSYIETVQKQS
jgi:preprotein translocase subunit YajC